MARCAAARQGGGLRHVHERHEGSQPWPGLGRRDESSGDVRPAADTWATAATRALVLGEGEATTTEFSAQGEAAAACAAWQHTEDVAKMLAPIEDAWAAEDIVAEVAS